MKIDASVVVDVFPQGICLGPHEFCCYGISKQEPTDEARMDERASLVVSFAVPDANPIPLRRMVDTGSGVSIMNFTAFNRVPLQTGVEKQSVCASNLMGTNFVVIDDAHGLEHFLLGRNFLKAYNVFVDLTSMKVVVRAPAKPV